jgi:hypothetical protein
MRVFAEVLSEGTRPATYLLQGVSTDRSGEGTAGSGPTIGIRANLIS